MGDYSQVMHEEALIARIISQARVVYGSKYPDGSTFDVVTSSPQYPSGYPFRGSAIGHVSWVVVYPKMKPYSAGTVVSAEWEPVLQSSADLSLDSTLNELLSKLRRKLNFVMGQVNKEGMEKCCS